MGFEDIKKIITIHQKEETILVQGSFRYPVYGNQL